MVTNTEKRVNGYISKTDSDNIPPDKPLNLVSALRRTGTATLPLHYGYAPPWLVSRMIGLADKIVAIIIDEYGQDELLRRLANPFWFQALGCVLGYDWHSSGVTTVLTGVLKTVFRTEDHGLAVAGGKGRTSRHAPSEIERIGDAFDLSPDHVRSLQYASRMTAKVDNTAIQAGYPLYHHAFIMSQNEEWVVIQQGMSPLDKTARRYHWHSDKVKSFVDEPHEAIVCDVVRKRALDMTAGESEECRKASVDLVKDGVRSLKRSFEAVRPMHQETLAKWIGNNVEEKDYIIQTLSMPRRINWNTLKNAYEFQPRNYEELLNLSGVGPATVRGLALVSEVIYGKPPSWRDPVKYSFAYGGKDGIPFPVNRQAMDESIKFLKDAIDRSKIDRENKIKSLQRLRRYVSE